MLDVSVSYNRYRFLGNEFLTWLWHAIVTDRGGDRLLPTIAPDLAALEVGNRMVLENHAHEAPEVVTIKGDEAGLEEAMMALRKGAMVAEMNLHYRSGDHQWRFNLKGESLSLTSLKPPDTGAVESREEIEGALLERVYLCERAVALVEALYRHFIHLRVSDRWEKETVPTLKEWIQSA